MGLGSSGSLSSIVFFCRFFAAGVRPFWPRFVLPREEKPCLHIALYSEKCAEGAQSCDNTFPIDHVLKAETSRIKSAMVHQLINKTQTRQSVLRL